MVNLWFNKQSKSVQNSIQIALGGTAGFIAVKAVLDIKDALFAAHRIDVSQAANHTLGSSIEFGAILGITVIALSLRK